MSSLRRTFCCAIGFLTALVPVVRPAIADDTAANAWQPERTWGVIVGVLEWERPGFTPFSKANRKDQELHDLLVARGVPEKNLRLLLDADATREKILAAIREMAKAAEADSTFLFYYAGHGMCRNDRFFFANYDAGPGNPDDVQLPLTRISTILERDFRGRRLMLLADCCHSGGLGDVAKQFAKDGRQAFALTSVAPDGLSTSNWTYSETILDGFHGRALFDRNTDGRVSLAELANEVDGAMRYLERQRSGFASFGMSEDFALSPAKGDRPSLPKDSHFQLGQFVRARDATGWVTGRLVGRINGTWQVELQAYATRSILRVPASDLQTLPDPLPIVDEAAIAEVPLQGSEALVKWGGRWWPAVILAVKGDGSGEVRIHYIGWPDSDDEWVGPDRYVPAEVKLEPAEILVEYGGTWWPARVLSEMGDRVRIRYVGWSARWDETVTPERIQSRQKPPAVAPPARSGRGLQ